MPFTLCHPALVLPLHGRARRWTCLPALAIGSMAPDFVYFFSLGVSGAFTHSIAGVVLYCVPAGLAVYAVYYALIRRPLLAWLPQAVGARMAAHVAWAPRSAQALAIVLASLAIGACTHIFWDAFTHDNTAIVKRCDMLRATVALGGHGVPLFKVLQQVSSLAGFLVIAAYLAAWFKRTAPAGAHPGALSRQGRLTAAAAVLAAGAAGGMAGLLLRAAASVERALFNVVVTGMAGAALAIVALCMLWTVKHGASARQG